MMWTSRCQWLRIFRCLKVITNNVSTLSVSARSLSGHWGLMICRNLGTNSVSNRIVPSVLTVPLYLTKSISEDKLDMQRLLRSVTLELDGIIRTMPCPKRKSLFLLQPLFLRHFCDISGTQAQPLLFLVGRQLVRWPFHTFQPSAILLFHICTHVFRTIYVYAITGPFTFWLGLWGRHWFRKLRRLWRLWYLRYLGYQLIISRSVWWDKELLIGDHWVNNWLSIEFTDDRSSWTSGVYTEVHLEFSTSICCHHCILRLHFF